MREAGRRRCRLLLHPGSRCRVPTIRLLRIPPGGRRKLAKAVQRCSRHGWGRPRPREGRAQPPSLRRRRARRRHAPVWPAVHMWRGRAQEPVSRRGALAPLPPPVAPLHQVIGVWRQRRAGAGPQADAGRQVRRPAAAATPKSAAAWAAAPPAARGRAVAAVASWAGANQQHKRAGLCKAAARRRHRACAACWWIASSPCSRHPASAAPLRVVERLLCPLACRRAPNSALPDLLATVALLRPMASGRDSGKASMAGLWPACCKECLQRHQPGLQ